MLIQKLKQVNVDMNGQSNKFTKILIKAGLKPINIEHLIKLVIYI